MAKERNFKGASMDEKNLLKLLDNAVDAALDELYLRDSYLFTREVHERTVVFRFGIYLQRIMDSSDILKQYDLDFEYNRNGGEPKRIPGRSRNGVFPDLIIHKRGSNSHNLLVMEFKTYWNPNTSDDCRKLEKFTDPSGKYKYQCGKSIILGEERNLTSIKSFFPSDISLSLEEKNINNGS